MCNLTIPKPHSISQAFLKEQNRQSELMAKGMLLDWLTGCSLGSSTLSLLYRRSRESGSCSVCEAGCLSSPNPTMESQRIPGELLAFKESSANGYINLSERVRIGGHKVKLPSTRTFIWPATRRFHPGLGWIFLLQIIRSGKIPPRTALQLMV